MGGFPAEFALDFTGIDGVTAIMAEAVLNEGDQFAGLTAEGGLKFVHQVTDNFNDGYIFKYFFSRIRK